MCAHSVMSRLQAEQSERSSIIGRTRPQPTFRKAVRRMYAHPDVRHWLPQVIEDTALDGERTGEGGINVVADFAVREGQRRGSQPVAVVCRSNLPEVLAQMRASHCGRVKDDDVRTCWNLSELV